jgi:hypothetical protein
MGEEAETTPENSAPETEEKGKNNFKAKDHGNGRTGDVGERRLDLVLAYESKSVSILRRNDRKGKSAPSICKRSKNCRKNRSASTCGEAAKDSR